MGLVWVSAGESAWGAERAVVVVVVVVGVVGVMVMSVCACTRLPPPLCLSHPLLELPRRGHRDGRREEREGGPGVAGEGEVEGGSVGTQEEEGEEVLREAEAQQPWW